MKAIQLSLFKPSSQLDFYCTDGIVRAYGEDARLAAKVIRNRLEYQNGTDVLSFSLIREADTILPRLVRAGFKVKLMGV